MFEYKSRTESKNGCYFNEQDILLFDYSYSGDCVVDCTLDYMNPGFGLFLAEDIEKEIVNSEIIYIFKLGTRNEYQIITKQVLDQKTVRDEFIEGGVDIAPPFNNLNLSFEFTENCKLTAFYYVLDEHGVKDKTMLFSYTLPNEITKYKIGFYSAQGNTIKHASIDSESPSNWVSNIYNANGGRINWIINGFQIEKCEYDCEVESQNIFLEKGEYFLDFECLDNKDLKYYVFKSYLKDTDEKRDMNEIMSTRIDETKNILDYEEKRFVLIDDGHVNIKFKGKFGTVKNITIKKHKEDSFVETDYKTTKKEASYLKFNLNKILKIEMEAEISRIPAAEEVIHSVFLSGPMSLSIEDLDIKLGMINSFVFEKEKGLLIVNDIEYSQLQEPTKENVDLFALKNVDAKVNKLLVTTTSGDVIDVLLQKTFRVVVGKEISTPIMVTDLENSPFDLSSNYREVVDETKAIEVFNKYNEIKLSKNISLSDPGVRVMGSNGIIDTEKDILEEISKDGKLISPNLYSIDTKNGVIKVNKDTKEKYKHIIVEYNHCDNFTYTFTNYVREIFDLEEEKNLFLEHQICDVLGSVIVYGIPYGTEFHENLIYRVQNKKAINSIDLCAKIYEELFSDSYSISSVGRISFETNVRDKYKYLIVDYIKDRSYSINEEEKYYEIDIATSEEKVKIIYDSTEEDVVNVYKKLDLDVVKDNFIVLRKE
jgi:hypothetical protein